jgi:HEPN domain-containing protein
MLNRWKSLVREAEKQLHRAEAARAASKPVWAWFAAHQSAEKAVKALRLRHQLNGHERMVTRLLLTLPESIEVPPDLFHKAHFLDSHYLPIQVAQSELHTPRTNGKQPADQAVQIAADIIEFVKANLDGTAEPYYPASAAPQELEPAVNGHVDVKEQRTPESPIEPLTA